MSTPAAAPPLSPLEVTTMSDAGARAAGSRWAWCARWLGLDHNPLRRPADRIEAALRVAVLLLLLIAVPMATVIAGRAADHIAEVGAFVVVTGMVLIVVLLSGQALARGALDRRRLRAWDAEWRATGPLWTGHRT